MSDAGTVIIVLIVAIVQASSFLLACYCFRSRATNVSSDPPDPRFRTLPPDPRFWTLPETLPPDSRFRTLPETLPPDSRFRTLPPDPSFWTLPETLPPDPSFLTLTMDKFLDDMERAKPIRFSPLQLSLATDNYSHLLGVGGFGVVYKGDFTNGALVAVKVLKGSSDKRIQEQFMAEVSTIGKIHHLNLVRLYGFCYERDLRALVYEYMENGSLDKFLFHENKAIEWEKLHEIAVGTAKGIAYLHEGCQQRIIHYDIKPGNVLLDSRFQPKVADFGLAKLCNRDDTHQTMTGGRGTPGYAAPELWMPFPGTHKCDVYSFGMLLFEVLGRRRNLDTNLPESQEWFPMWVWKEYERGEMGHALVVCGIEEKDKDKAQRMAMVALWCVQYLPVPRPSMSVVVKMLEGGVEIPAPPNPFQYLFDGSPCMAPFDNQTWTGSSNPGTESSIGADRMNLPIYSTPIMRKYEIELASS